MIWHLISLIFAGLSIGLGYNNHLFIKERVIVVGRVVFLERSGTGDKNFDMRRIVARFVDSSGIEHLYKAGFSTNHPGYDVGDSIRIAYRESDPSSCGIYSFGYRYAGSFILGSISVALVIIGTGYRYGQSIMDWIYNVPMI